MKITKLSADYANTISQMLSDYFKKTNNILGFEAYDASFTTNYRHVKIRMMSSDVYYVGLLDENDKLLGFVNYCENNLRNEFNIWTLVGNLTLEQKELLAEYCIEQYKTTGFRKITLETRDNEQDVIYIFTKLGSKKISNNHILV